MYYGKKGHGGEGGWEKKKGGKGIRGGGASPTPQTGKGRKRRTGERSGPVEVERRGQLGHGGERTKKKQKGRDTRKRGTGKKGKGGEKGGEREKKEEERERRKKEEREGKEKILLMSWSDRGELNPACLKKKGGGWGGETLQYIRSKKIDQLVERKK